MESHYCRRYSNILVNPQRQTSKMTKTIAVIGAGPSGLTAIKSCKEEGLGVVCFERSGHMGGLWRFHEDTVDGQPSVMKSTVINTSKDMSAFSDFPPPKEYPNYMHNTLMLKYFESYAKKFDLEQHIRYHQDVVDVSQASDYMDTGRWTVKAVDRKTQIVSEEVFDGVMVCVGHHIYPSLPNFAGQNRFKGIAMHSHALKIVDDFKDLNVLVVGFGSSAVDAAVEISNVAKQVYLSTRRGSWVLPRSGPKGLPTDAIFSCRFNNAVQDVIGWKNISRIVERYFLNFRFDHSLYGIQPEHHVLSQHTSINDYFQGKVLTGRVIIKKDVKEFSEDSVLFDKEEAFVPIDAVIFATGYFVRFPFLDSSILKQSGNRVELYKLTFPSHLKHPSLAFIGLVQPHGAIFPIAESQSRWFALLQTGKIRLPSAKKMEESIRRRRTENMSRYVDSQRHTLQVDMVSFMDEIAVEYGAKPNMCKLLFYDPLLFWVCLWSPCFPYQFRLQGPHSWPLARKTLLEFPQRFTAPFSGGIKPRFYRYSEILYLMWYVPVMGFTGVAFFFLLVALILNIIY